MKVWSIVGALAALALFGGAFAGELLLAALQFAQQMIAVEPRKTPIHPVGAKMQLQRNGNRRRGKQVNSLALLSQPFQQYVAAQGITHRGHRRVWMPVFDPPVKVIQVSGIAGVITAGRLVRLTAAAAKIQGDSAKSTLAQGRLQALDVTRTR